MPSTSMTRACLWSLGRRAIAAARIPAAPGATPGAALRGPGVLPLGLTKLRDWDVTLALFQDQYHVPLLDPVTAAWLGTGGEIVLPVLLALALAGRLCAATGLGTERRRRREPRRDRARRAAAAPVLGQSAPRCCCGGRGDGRSMRSSCRGCSAIGEASAAGSLSLAARPSPAWGGALARSGASAI